MNYMAVCALVISAATFLFYYNVNARCAALEDHSHHTANMMQKVMGKLAELDIHVTELEAERAERLQREENPDYCEVKA